MKQLITYIVFLALTSTTSFASNFTLKKAQLDGSDWQSASIKDKVFMVVYVDPDKKNLNNSAAEAVKKEGFPKEKFQSIAIINMKATVLPNFLLTKALKSKQKKYPKTLYLKDYSKKLIKEWQIQTKGNDFFLFNKEGKEIFRHYGKLSPQKTKDLIELIKTSL